MEKISEDGQGTKQAEHLEGIEDEDIFNLNKLLEGSDRTLEVTFIEANEKQRCEEELFPHGPMHVDWAQTHYTLDGVTFPKSLVEYSGDLNQVAYGLTFTSRPDKREGRD